jgi:hypothetical protein
MRPGCLRDRYGLLEATEIFAQFITACPGGIPRKERGEIGGALPIAATRGFPY